ncbi:MAG: SBBP repeat-containing protein [Bacteroidia bacterium]|nr:SBBP repeat-containing protein [Bacteroidia bacterium]
MLKFISFYFLSLLFINFSSFGGNPSLPETLQNKEKPKICFTENKGQMQDQFYKPRPDVLYGAMAGDMAVHIKKNGVSYQLYRVDKFKEVEDAKTKEKRQEIEQQTIYRVDLTWVNANKNFTKSEDETLPGYNNYYLESCPNGALNVKSYKGVSLLNIYPGINLHYYEKNGELKHDYIVEAHADYKQIQIKVEGAEISVNKDGSLLLNTPLGKIQEGALIVYQNNKKLNAKWRIKNNILGFEIENYNPNYELIIDPVTRLWGTYYGGTAGEEVHFVTTDLSGDVYMTGYTNSSFGTMIATIGSHQSTGAANGDAFLVKFNSLGARLWGTYYGSPTYDIGFSCCTDLFGNVFMTGYTQSSNGTSIATIGSHQQFYGGGYWDSFLVKFNNAGVRQWGTYYGGLNADSGRSCATDTSGNVYLVGNSSSFNGIATVGSHQPLHAGGTNDAYLAKFNSAGVLQWSTYYGETSEDVGYSCSIDALGNIYLAGYTDSNAGTGVATLGSHQSVYGGGICDAFLVKFNALGVRQWGTYYGGSGEDFATCTVDPAGNVFLAGYTDSSSIGVVSTIGSHQPNYGGGYKDGFLVKFNTSGVRQWGTYYGGLGEEVVTSCITDPNGDIYLAGSSNSTVGTVIATNGSYQSFHAGSSDAFLVKIYNSGQRHWGTYYGGVSGESGTACSIDMAGNLYLGGNTQTSAGTDISTSGSHQPSFGGLIDGFLVKFMYCEGVNPIAQVNNTVCVNSTIIFSVSISGTIVPSYSWNGPASFTSNIQNPSIASASAVNVGIYTLTVNSNGCVETLTTQIYAVVNPTILVNSGSICSGNNFTITPTGANSYTITGGSFIVNPTITTSYSISGTSSEGCISTSVALSNVTVNPTPSVQVNSGNICLGESFTISPSGANTYSITGGSFLVSPNITTSYSVTGTSTAACVSAPVVSTVNVSECVGISENPGINPSSVKVYPNPNNGLFNVESNTEAKVLVIDLQGRIIGNQSLVSGKNQISIEHLENGVYFLEVSHPHGKEVFRIVKQ